MSDEVWADGVTEDEVVSTMMIEDIDKTINEGAMLLTNDDIWDDGQTEDEEGIEVVAMRITEEEGDDDDVDDDKGSHADEGSNINVKTIDDDVDITQENMYEIL